MANNYDSLNFTVNATDNASNVLNNIVNLLNKIQKINGSGSSKNKKGFEYFSQTGDLIKKDIKLAKYAGNLKVYNTAKRNVAVATELNHAYYIQERRIHLLNQARKKAIDEQLKEELGLKKVKKAVQATQNVKHTSNDLGKLIFRLSTVVIIAKKLGHFMGDALEQTGAYVENLNLFAVTFGKTYQDTAKWALNIANNFGLASNEVIRFTGLFKQLSTAIGIVGDTGTEVSRILTSLGYDKLVA